MTTIETMYAPQVNSPATTLSANISSSATSISVLSGATLPAAPNLLVIGGDTENAETVRMTAKSGNTITVVRGVQGTARSWNTGALIARLFTAKDLADVQTNITNLNSGKAEKTDLNAANDRIDEVYANSASGSIANFERITGGMPVNSLEVAITPKQAGSGNPSPTNVRAITGWTGATIYACGENHLTEDGSLWGQYGLTASGFQANVGRMAPYTYDIPFEQGKTYTINLVDKMRTGKTFNVGVGEYNPATTRIVDSGWQSLPYTFTVNSATTVLRMSFKTTDNSGTADYIAALGTGLVITMTEAAPTTNSISFGQTVYCGKLNVTTGVLQPTHVLYDLGSKNWSYSSSGSGRMQTDGIASVVKRPVDGNAVADIYCEIYKPNTSNNVYTGNPGIAVNANNGYIWVYDANMGTDAAAFKTAVTGKYLAYPLATLPDPIQLTPTEVTTLLGENNIWADTGDVIEVTFGEDIKAYVDAEAADKQDKITVSGILKGDGEGGISAAVAGTDYQAPLTAGTDYQTPLDEKALQWYGVCSTSASTQAKTVSITGITALTEGLEIRVKMTNAQTYNGTPTLNVNSLGAKTIKQHGSTDAVRYQWQAGEVISFTYDGTYWVIENNSLATTTYFGLTRLNSATNSTAEDCAATPKAVKTAYDLADAAIPATEKGTDVATLVTAADSTTPSVPRLTPAQGFAPIFDITADTTLAAKHAGGILKCTNSPTITIPSNVFAEATQIEILNYGIGVVTIAGASGCSVNGTSAGSVTLADQYKSAVLLAISASQWVIQGAIE